jgi:MFS family permease
MLSLHAASRSAVVTGFAVLFVTTGVNFSFGILFKPIAAELGTPRTTLALAATASLLVNALTQPVFGNLVDRWGPRRVILPSIALMAMGTALAALAESGWQFILLYGVVSAFGYTGSGVLPVSVHVTRWFPVERGVVMAIVASGFSMGHLVFTQFAVHTAAAMGWRGTYALLAAILLASTAVFARWLRDAPRPGDGAPQAEPSPAAIGTRPSLSRGAALATGGFWAMTASLVGCGFTDFLLTTHLAPHTADLGLRPAVAANAVSLWAGANVVGILAAGALAARFGARPALVGTYALRATSFAWLLLAREPWQLYVFAVLFGATFFTTAPLASTMIATFFGPRHHGAIFGTANFFHHTAGALGSLSGGLVFDLTGSYRPIFLVSAFITAGASLVALLARPPRREPGATAR